MVDCLICSKPATYIIEKEGYCDAHSNCKERGCINKIENRIKWSVNNIRLSKEVCSEHTNDHYKRDLEIFPYSITGKKN